MPAPDASPAHIATSAASLLTEAERGSESLPYRLLSHEALPTIQVLLGGADDLIQFVLRLKTATRLELVAMLRLRLELTRPRSRVFLDDQMLLVDEEQARFVDFLFKVSEKRGASVFVPFHEIALDIPVLANERADNWRRKLPDALKAYVEVKRGKGGGCRLMVEKLGA